MCALTEADSIRAALGIWVGVSNADLGSPASKFAYFDGKALSAAARIAVSSSGFAALFSAIGSVNVATDLARKPAMEIPSSGK